MKPWFFIGVCFSKFGLDLEKKTKNTLLNAGDIQLVGGFNPLEKY